MLSRNKVKEIKALHSKKGRLASCLFIAEGLKVVQELLRSPFKIKEIYVSEEYKNEFSDFSNLFIVKSDQLSQISMLTTSPEVLAVAEMPKSKAFDPKETGFILALDDIRDPGNLGTIIRTADWFSIQTVLCSRNTVELFNPKVVQSSMGSAFRVNVIYCDLLEQLSEAKHNGKKIIGTTLSGSSIYNTAIQENSVLIIGNESNGVNESLKEIFDIEITIPGGERTESLNAAIATSIICYEQRRQKAKL